MENEIKRVKSKAGRPRLPYDRKTVSFNCAIEYEDRIKDLFEKDYAEWKREKGYK
jgi:hypothetical protein